LALQRKCKLSHVVGILMVFVKVGIVVFFLDFDEALNSSVRKLMAKINV